MVRSVLGGFATTLFHTALAADRTPGCTSLRLLPIRGGIFGGDLADTPARMAAMTVDGLTGGHALLTTDEQEQLRDQSAELHMCLFVQNELPAFQAAWEQGQRVRL